MGAQNAGARWLDRRCSFRTRFCLRPNRFGARFSKERETKVTPDGSPGGFELVHRTLHFDDIPNLELLLHGLGYGLFELFLEIDLTYNDFFARDLLIVLVDGNDARFRHLLLSFSGGVHQARLSSRARRAVCVG